ncbi:MAG: tetratricopeptide repeat protein, partial [bacterium]|nr:tetratricopeptide repeat protein [bacterium]
MIFLLFFLLSENKSDIYYKMGVEFFNVGKYKTATKYFKKAIKHEPKNATYYYMLGLSYEKQGKILEA